MFEWFAVAMSKYQQPLAWALFWSAAGAIGFGLASGQLLGAIWGGFVGLIGGPLVYRAQQHERRKRAVEKSPRAVRAREVELITPRWYWFSVLVGTPTVVVAGFILSFVVTGDGAYGIPLGVSVAVVAAALGKRILAKESE